MDDWQTNSYLDSTTSQVLGIDIGGAHIKLANSAGHSAAWPFPMWSAAKELGCSLRAFVDSFCEETNACYSQLALTMTGEMADCFASRAMGVDFILNEVAAKLPELKPFVYSVQGEWLTSEMARLRPWEVAASNWHALAQWIARCIVKPGEQLQLVLDIGSTTVDVIPLLAGCIATDARCDSERLRKRQLVYTGIGRTPIASILSTANIAGNDWPLVAERFATSDDAYVVLGLVSADGSDENEGDQRMEEGRCHRPDCDTADGRPRTVMAATARLARMLGEDCERLIQGEVTLLARQVVECQARQIARAIFDNLPPAHSSSNGDQPRIVISGHGSPLAQAAIAQLPFPVDCVYLADRISPNAARCAPAVAVAWLLEEHLGDRLTTSMP